MPSIQKILSEMNAPKTAAASTPAAPSVAETRQALAQSLQQDKTANTVDPVISYEKLASQLGDLDFAGTMREGELMGAAVFDGFLKRANEYAAHAAKHAAEFPEDEEEEEEEDEEEEEEDMEKEASASLIAGGRAALEKVAALSRGSFEYGFACVNDLLDSQEG